MKSGYLTEGNADKSYAPIGTVAVANDAKAAASTAQTTATQAQNTATQAQNLANSAQSKAEDALGKLNGIDGTVKSYVDDKVGSAGSTINVQTVNGVTYICRTGTCLDTPPSAYWAPIEVNISDEYLTETEGDMRYAPKAEYALKSDIGTLGGSFSSVADKIGLNNSNDWTNSNKSVKQYVDDKFSSISTDIQVETGTDGFTYICKTGNNCHLPIASYPSEWAKVNVDLGNLGINTQTNQAYNVAQKIGLTDSANINKTVVGYIGEQIGSLGTYYDSSTYMQKPHSVLTYLQANYVPLTKLGTDITSDASKTVSDYISAKIGALGGYYDSSYNSIPYTSVKQYVDDKFALKTSIGDLGASYTVAQKIGLTESNASKTVKQYVDELIGTSSLGNYTNVIAYGNANYASKNEFDTLSSTVLGHTNLLSGFGSGVTVKDYVDSKTPNIQIAAGNNDGTMWYCTLSTQCDTSHVDSYHGWASFNISDSLNLSSYLKSADAVATYLTIASATNNYYTKTESDVRFAEKSVQTAVEDPTTGLGATYNLATNASGAATTAKQTADAAQNAAEAAQTTANTANTTANNAWDRVKSLGKDVNGDEYTTVAGRLGFDASANSKTVKQYVDDKVGSLGNTADSTPATSVADKLGTAITGANKTVAKYIEDYVAEHAASGGVTVRTVTNNGVSETYICSENCENDPPCKANDTPDTCGWQKLEVDLSQYLKSSDAASTYLPRTNLKLVREGADIHLKRVVGDNITDYGIVAGVQDLMCKSYRTESVEPGQDGCPESGSVCYKMICNTNDNN